MSKGSEQGAPHIVLTGTYCSLNRGDATMQLVCAEALARRLPGVEITIHSPFPSIDTPFYERRGLPVATSTRRKLVKGTLRWGRMAFARGDMKGASEEERILREADLVVDLSGDMLTEDYGVHVAYSHYLPLLQVLAADVPLVLCAQSIGPFQYTAFLARRIFGRAALVTLREARSLDHLRTLGVRPGRVEVTADLAFALQPAGEGAVQAALAAEGITLGPEPVVGVSLSSLVERDERSGGPLRERVAEALRSAAVPIGARVLLVPHVYGPKPAQDDRRALGALHELLRASFGERVNLLRAEHEPEVLKGIIARCEVFVGARMHAVMAALSGAVPVVALAYSHKAYGIMQEFGMGDWVYDSGVVQEEELTRAVVTLIERRSGIHSMLREKAATARRAAERNVDLIVELLNERRALV